MDYSNYWKNDELFGPNNWTKCADLFEIIVKNSPDDAIFVELGTYLGRSAALWASLILKHNKKQHVYTIDHHLIVPGQWVKAVNNLMPFIKMNLITTIKSDSIAKNTLNKFTNNSISAIYIDAGHNYNELINDVHTWWPKMMPGSIISGDDYLARYDQWKGMPWDAGPELPIIKAITKLFPSYSVYAPEGWPLWIIRKAGGINKPEWNFIPEIQHPR